MITLLAVLGFGFVVALELAAHVGIWSSVRKLWRTMDPAEQAYRRRIFLTRALPACLGVVLLMCGGATIGVLTGHDWGTSWLVAGAAFVSAGALSIVIAAFVQAFTGLRRPR